MTEGASAPFFLPVASHGGAGLARFCLQLIIEIAHPGVSSRERRPAPGAREQLRHSCATRQRRLLPGCLFLVPGRKGKMKKDYRISELTTHKHAAEVISEAIGHRVDFQFVRRRVELGDLEAAPLPGNKSAIVQKSLERYLSGIGPKK